MTQSQKLHGLQQTWTRSAIAHETGIHLCKLERLYHYNEQLSEKAFSSYVEHKRCTPLYILPKNHALIPIGHLQCIRNDINDVINNAENALSWVSEKLEQYEAIKEAPIKGEYL